MDHRQCEKLKRVVNKNSAVTALGYGDNGGCFGRGRRWSLDEGWLYRKQIVIDYTQVGANLTDFPMLVSLSADTDLVARARHDGGDINFHRR